MDGRGEIAISVVVLIALGLIVLVILGTLLGIRLIGADQAARSCENVYHGTCMSEQTCRFQGGTPVSEMTTCQDSASTGFSGQWILESFGKGGSICCINN